MSYFGDRYKESGLCTRCGIRKARPGLKTCESCADKQKRYRADKKSKPEALKHTISDIVKYAQKHGISYGQAVLIIDKEDDEKCVI